MPTKRKPSKPNRNNAAKPTVRRSAATRNPSGDSRPSPASNRPSVKAKAQRSNQADSKGKLQDRQRPSLAGKEEERFEGVTLDIEGKQVTLTRRHFLYGALGAGAAAIMAAGAVLSDDGENQGSFGIDVAESSVTQLEDLEEAERDSNFTLIAEYTLPFGTLVWANSDDIACCLAPTEQASPLTQVSVMELSTGASSTVLDAATGQSEGFEILDARASRSGVIWTEANTMEAKWRILCAPLSDTLDLGDARILEEGDSQIEIPTIAAVGDCAWWQSMPSAEREDANKAQSSLMRASFQKGSPECVYSATGRMACQLCPCSDGVAIAAKDPEHTGAFDLLKFSNSGTEAQDRLTLPSGMTPSAIGWGPNGFSFCFEGIYDYGGGISNLGTYTPKHAHNPNSSYDGLEWFRFGRTPSTGPFWCGEDWYLVKSTLSVCAVNLSQGIWCSLDVESGCTGWGDHLCSTGSGSYAVTAMQIEKGNSSTGGQAGTLVRVWEADSDLYA